MSTAVDLMEGVAQLLADAGLGTWAPTYPAGTPTYPAGTPTPIYLHTLPVSAPARAIAVAHYPLTRFGWDTDSVEGIQVKVRAPGPDPSPAAELADDVRAALDGLEHVQLGGTHVSLLSWQSGASLGSDANQRWETTANFHAITARPLRP